MSTRAASWLATALAAALAALAVSLFILLLALAPGIGRTPGAFVTGNWTDEVPFVVVHVATVLVGAVIAAKRPRNPIGWLLALLGLGFIIYPVVVVVVASFLGPEEADAPLWVHLVAWAGNWLWILGHAAAIFLLLLFPNGRPLSGRWRPVVWLAGVLVVAMSVVAATHEGPLEAAPRLENPLGLFPTPEFLLYAFLGGVLALEFLACALLVVRFFRSRGEERQQMKWVAFGVVILAAYLLLNLLFGLPRWAAALAPGVLVATIAFAILKYRLYDIDLIINRTFVYGSLTATLALVYAGSVVSLQAALRSLTGQESTLAVVASTLAIAALFNPLRRRVQAFVDRLFYRRKYDAAKTLATFSVRLRDETQLDTLSEDLVGVVTRTVQPAYASLWLRPEAGSKGEQAD